MESGNEKLTPTSQGDYLWPQETLPEDLDYYRVPGEAESSHRDAEEIPPEESAMAALTVLKNAISIPREDLERETAQEFGFGRMGTRVRDCMSAGIALLIERGDAIADENVIKLARN